MSTQSATRCASCFLSAKCVVVACGHRTESRLETGRCTSRRRSTAMTARSPGRSSSTQLPISPCVLPDNSHFRNACRSAAYLSHTYSPTPIISNTFSFDRPHFVLCCHLLSIKRPGSR